MFIWQLVAFLAGRGAAKSFSGLETSYRFAQLTDVHIEPFYNPERGHLKGGVCRVPEAFNKSSCVPFKVEPEAATYPLGRLNCDPPFALLRSVLEHMAHVAETEKPDFVMFTGDIPSHQLSCQFHQARTIEMVIEMMADKLKKVAPTWFPAMGNNDYFPNYNVSMEPNSPWQQFVASIYAREGVLSGEQLKTFAAGGYYSASPRPGLKVIVLNTVVWSQKVLDWNAAPKKHVHHHQDVSEANLYHGPDAPLEGSDTSGWVWDEDVASKKIFVDCDARPADPYGQLAWARQELLRARSSGQRVIVAGHVPPGNKVGSNNFCQQHLDDFKHLTQDFADIIEVQLYGDHSNDEFRMVWEETPRPRAVSSILVSAGVTPRKHCNPSWRMFEVSKEHQVSDFSQYFLRLADTDIQLNMDSRWEKLHRLGRDEEVSWKFWQKQYSFRDQYGVGLDPEELQELWMALQRDPGLLRTYVSHMFSQTVGNYDYFDYICDMRYLSEEKNDACSARGALLESPPPLELRRAIGPTSLLSSKSDAEVAETYGSMRLAVLGASLTLNLLLGSVVLLMVRRRRREEAASYVALP
ncbi:Sphingomyelinase phosphodiesterase C [Symbiodinium microadriaticum]|uniref:Sphingomyelinase phosphodiesterase C n=1 Tax=Symbiodinium microadriaticum TaxID=2951 RepID=A0A1Q9E184_SYMMI|nr:Sphingomyelinase phosphodiesterase C [Symbiodinium microadriaticum]CAE7770760.1 sgmC [Symbiodinium sp. KB8]CAE7888181.1 sgmC [Symbiodinium microadriaticum]